MLSEGQIAWVEREARRTFNLTGRRAEVLLLMLAEQQGFSFSEIEARENERRGREGRRPQAPGRRRHQPLASADRRPRPLLGGRPRP